MARSLTRTVVLALAIGFVVLLGLTSTVVHDLRCNRDAYMQCQRADGSRWQDPSDGCTSGEDPRCVDGRGCVDSRIIRESTRSCSWAF